MNPQNAIQVLRQQYHWDAPRQYLVCVVTGVWPGSAADSDLTLTLIGDESFTSPSHLKPPVRFEVRPGMSGFVPN